MKRLQYSTSTLGAHAPFVDYELWKREGTLYCVYSGVTHSAISTTSFANRVIAAIREEEGWNDLIPVEFYDFMTWQGLLLQSSGTYEFARVLLNGEAFELDYELECPMCVLDAFRSHIGGGGDAVRIWNGELEVPEQLKPLSF